MSVRVSIAMAVYNGEKYIKEQLDSILEQISDEDEIIVSLNPSIDKTAEILSAYTMHDERIKIFPCERKGVQANFNNAIEKATGKYIFLCDQDDVWLENKIEIVLDAFVTTNADIIVHDGYITNANLDYDIKNTIFCEKKSRRGIVKNLIKNSYHGCCMAMKDSIKDIILPLPSGPFFHDYWIGLLCEVLNKRIVFIDYKLILYRRHNENQSGSEGRTILDKVRERFYLLLYIGKRIVKLHLMDG